MKENEVFVLASETLSEEGDDIMSWFINGITRDPKVARAWAAGSLHSAYLVEIDGDLNVDGIPSVDFRKS